MKIKLITLLMLISVGGISQEKDAKVYVVPCSEFGVTPALIDIQVDPILYEGKTKIINEFRHRKAAQNLPHESADDPIRQHHNGNRTGVEMVANFDGTQNNEAGGYSPPDPSGAVGPNHYVQMVNVAMEVFDLEGNSLWGPTFLDDVFPSANNAGDPVVLYDEAADRWFISQFQFDNTIRIGITQTADPLGEWYWYSFQFPQFPDYPKYSVWSDGYYVSSNMGSTNSAAFEREKMLAGDPTATAVLLQLPDQGTTGFETALPVDLEGFEDPGRPAMIINCNDEAWGSQPDDHLRIWEFDVDWETPGNSSLEILTTLPTEPFDAVFPGFGFNNIDQPGNPNSLDAIGEALLFPAKFRDFGSYHTLVCTHAVDVDGAGTAGMRWYELRDDLLGEGWYIYQSGTYAPGVNGDSRWMGSIGIDIVGNISLAYSVSGEETYPSLRFTGRYASDPLGEMTIAECEIAEGLGTQFNNNRWGDYAQMTVDPVEGFTFWFTGEYTRNSGGSWGTKIAAWRLQTPAAVDLGTISIDAPESGALAADEPISVTIRNFGLEDQSNFDVGYVINGGTLVTETFTGTIPTGEEASFDFATTSDMSAYGDYNIMAYTSILEDGWALNDTMWKTVTHLFPQDVGVTGIIAPVTNQLLTDTETVTVTVENFGSNDASNFPITFILDGGTPVTETVMAIVPAQGSVEYTFTATADLSFVADYDFDFYTELTDDFDTSNDSFSTTVSNLTPVYCFGSSDCSSFNDAILRVRLNDIDNVSGCSEGSYGDYTSISTQIAQGQTYEFGVEVGYPDHYVTMWIDLDGNYAFTADEKFVDVMYVEVEEVESVENVTFPVDMPLGTYRMRVRTTWLDDAPLDPCVDQTWGETEDYTVEVVEDSGVSVADLNASVNFFVTQNTDHSVATVNMSGMEGTTEAMLVDSRGRLVRWKQFTASAEHTEEIDTRFLVAGVYLVVLKNGVFRKTERIIINR